MPVEEAKETYHYVFVYGTLKSGESYNHFLARPTDGRASLVGPARTVKKWPLVLASSYKIPCMLPYEGVGHEVYGEVYEVDDRMLELLDRLESHPDFYVRSLQDVDVLSQPHSEGADIEAVTNSAKSSPKLPGNHSGFPSRRKVWVYFMRKNEEELLKLPHVSSYTLKPGINLPELTADKEESQRFLTSEFLNVPRNDSGISD
uniref:Gamma-glutamylcyclotransferase family protein n=1 Tax=Amblyomma tuberculatum TaxID=48802 RepID=A0A6M2E8C8_9ACAR